MMQDETNVWPEISSWELDNFYRLIRATVLELEEAFVAGELADALKSSDLAKTVGAELAKTYEKLARDGIGDPQHLRLDAVRALLAQVRDEIFLVRKVAQAEVLERHKASRQAGLVRLLDPKPAGIARVRARFDESASEDMRIDQVLAVRFWGIGFEFDQVETTNEVARLVARASTERLAHDLLRLQLVLRRFKLREPEPKLNIVPLPCNRRFEHLMLDILNEETQCARMAPVEEDFLEKTDLRVTYPSLARNRGGRVQVTQISDPDRHRVKLAGIRGIEEYVVLSPRTIAEFIVRVESGEEHAVLTLSPVDLDSFWHGLNRRPVNVDALAIGIKRVLLQSLENTLRNPRGPLSQVPPVVRHVIRIFVQAETYRSTLSLRERERTHGRAPNNHKTWSPSRRGGRKAADPIEQAKVQERKQATLQKLRVGDRVAGRVGNVMDYGVFIDLGGVDGLLHINQIPDPKDAAVREMLRQGTDVVVVVLSIDTARGRVSLGLP